MRLSPICVDAVLKVFRMKYFLLLLLALLVSVRAREYAQAFHSSGRILQLEHAKKAVKRGSTIIAVACADGILVLVDAPNLRNDALMVKNSLNNKFMIDKHLHLLITGLVFDAIPIVDVAIKKAINYKNKFDEIMPCEYLCEEIADILHAYTKKIPYSRALGISSILIGYDKVLGYQIYSIDSQGSYTGWNAVCAGGKYEDEILNNLPKYIKNMKNNAMMSVRGQLNPMIDKYLTPNVQIYCVNINDDVELVWKLID